MSRIPPRYRRRIGPDLLVGAIILAGVVWFASRATTQVPYTWQWDALLPYLIRTQPDVAPGLLLQGVAQTLRLALWAGIVALILGLAGGIAQGSHSPYWRILSGIVIQTVRNTPPLVLVFLGYFFLADQLTLLHHLQNLARHTSGAQRELVEWLWGPVGQIQTFASAACILGIMEGAYVAEIVRAGLESIPRGQWDAAYALGLSKAAILRHIVIPQALRIMIPPLTNQGISTVKDSAIMAVISIQELTFQGMQLMATTYRAFEVWIAVAGIYFLLTTMLSALAHALEQHFKGEEIS
jgi:polar amino acid transport system permease protein